MNFLETTKLPDLSFEKKSKIKIVENLNIGSSCKAEIILILLGEKPATEYTLHPWNEDPTSFQEKLESIGLVVIKESIISDTNKPPKKIDFYIAKDAKTATKLSTLNPAVDHEEFGALMGFPHSAIKAFLSGKRKDYPTENKIRDGVVFGMAMSKDNFEQELALLKHWSNLIKQYAPDTYKSLLPIAS